MRVALGYARSLEADCISECISECMLIASLIRCVSPSDMLGAWRLRAKLEALRTTLSERKAQRRTKREGSEGHGGSAPAPPPGGKGGGNPGGSRFGSWGSVPPSSPQAGEAECAERPLGGDAISPLNLLNLDGATCTKLEVKRSYRLKAREYHPDKYAGSKSCAEMHFHSLRAAQEAALLICK